MARRLPSEGKSSCNQPSTLALPGWLGAGEDPFPAEDSYEWPIQNVWVLPEFTTVLGLAWGEEFSSELSRMCPCGQAALGPGVSNQEGGWGALWQECCLHAQA